jgi:hypothetical protein
MLADDFLEDVPHFRTFTLDQALAALMVGHLWIYGFWRERKGLSSSAIFFGGPLALRPDPPRSLNDRVVACRAGSGGTGPAPCMSASDFNGRLLVPVIRAATAALWSSASTASCSTLSLRTMMSEHWPSEATF